MQALQKSFNNGIRKLSIVVTISCFTSTLLTVLISYHAL